MAYSIRSRITEVMALEASHTRGKANYRSTRRNCSICISITQVIVHYTTCAPVMSPGHWAAPPKKVLSVKFKVGVTTIRKGAADEPI